MVTFEKITIETKEEITSIWSNLNRGEKFIYHNLTVEQKQMLVESLPQEEGFFRVKINGLYLISVCANGMSSNYVIAGLEKCERGIIPRDPKSFLVAVPNIGRGALTDYWAITRVKPQIGSVLSKIGY